MRKFLCTMLVMMLCGFTSVASATDYEDWTSDNQGQSSTTSTHSWTIVANQGDILSFDWQVSSETNYDKLTVKIDEKILVDAVSGEETNFSYFVFPSAGTYTLTASYSKDRNSDRGSDMGRIYNIGINSINVSVIDGVSFVVSQEGNVYYIGGYQEGVIYPETITINNEERTVSYQFENTYTNANGNTFGFSYNTDLASVKLISYLGGNTSLVIPGVVSINGVSYTVTTFGTIFKNNKEITAVSFTNEPFTIDYQAFYGCSAMTSIDNLSACQSIGNSAFCGCTSLTSLGDLSACTSIGNNAFDNCSHLTSVGDLSACQSIGSQAFYGCSALTSVGDLSACQSIGSLAFYGCSALTSLGDLFACQSIGYQAFYGCSALTSLGDLSACQSIGSQAFENCSHLTSVGDLSSCTSISYNAFYSCSSLISIGDLSACQSIGSQAFENCSHLTSVGDLSSCTSISSNAFHNCSALTSVDLSVCQSIGDAAFYDCSALTSVGDLSSCINISPNTFCGCSALTSVDLSNCQSIDYDAFLNCTSLTSVGDLSACQSIGSFAFAGCSALTSVNLSNCQSIDNYAFHVCSSLTSLDLSSCTSIGESTFADCRALEEVHLGEIVPTLGASAFDMCGAILYVPQSQWDTYRSAAGWSDLRTRILAEETQHEYQVTVSANSSSSSILSAVGESNTGNVVSLKVIGDINSYDIFALRNKMTALRHLDLSEAHIVACPGYHYYSTNSTQDNIIGNNMFKQLPLFTILLPQDITCIGSSAFNNCYYLKIINIPASVTKIGSSAFASAISLRTVVLNDGLISIEDGAFSSCPIANITLPNTLQTISYGALDNIHQTEIVLPASLRSIGGYAFPSTLRKVYVAVVDPFAISDNTFGDYKNCDLYVPVTEEWSTTYNKYYWDTQWGQFASVKSWNPTYDNFYINNDYELDGGTIRGEEDGEGNVQAPDADFGAGSGFIVDGTGHQDIDEGHIQVETSNGTITSSGSLIGGEDGNHQSNLNINTLYCDIHIEGGRWYFFSFPFNVDLAQVTCKRTDNPTQEANTVWRFYNGNERATHGVGNSWTNQSAATDPNTLLAGVGYIFQANKNSTLSIPMSNVTSTDEQNHDLNAHASGNAADADWNFTGNPYLSYYQISDIHTFDAPITIWNGSAYEAIRPGDDDYTFTPFQAFFVQKPADADNVGFEKEHRQTKKQSEESHAARVAARRAAAQVNPDRLVINLTLSDGNYTDKTRVVYNDAHSLDYEASCDAAKFFSSEAVPQLYSVNGDVKYAINERPVLSTECRLGYSAAHAGELTLSAQRMDMPMLLFDRVENRTWDFIYGDYTFTTQAGDFADRFILQSNGYEMGISNIYKETGVSIMGTAEGINLSGINGQTVAIYTLTGAQVATAMSNGLVSLPQGAYVVAVGELSTKTLVR